METWNILENGKLTNGKMEYFGKIEKMENRMVP